MQASIMTPNGRRLSSGFVFRAMGSALVLLAALAPSRAQDVQDAGPTCVEHPADRPREIGRGMCLRSSIDPDDARNAANLPYEDWRLPLRQGEAVRIDLVAIAATPEDEPFDTYLELRRPGAGEPLAVNDDQPDSLNSRIDFAAPATGDYIVRVRPLLEDDSGGYTLRIGAMRPPLEIVPVVGGRAESTIAPSTQARPGRGSRNFGFDGVAGERVRVTVTADAPPVVMRLSDPDGGLIGFAASPTETVSMVRLLPRTGSYQLNVHSRPRREPTALALALERRAAPGPRPPRPIRVGESVPGDLGLDSSIARDPAGLGEILTEEYRLDLAAGETATVTLHSSAFNAVLDAGAGSVLGFAVAARDGGRGRNSNIQLVLRPTAPGPILLRVRGLQNGTGAYRLAVVAGEPPQVP